MKKERRCELCAQRVVVQASYEGSNCYLPLERRATLNEAAVTILAQAALEKRTEAHSALVFAAETVRGLITHARPCLDEKVDQTQRNVQG